MSYLQGRRFNFFEKDEAPMTSEASGLLSDLLVTVCTSSGSGRGPLLLGDSNGFIYEIFPSEEKDKRGLMEITSFRAYAICVNQMFQMRRQKFLVTVGIEDIGDQQLRVWNLEKRTANGAPFSTRSSRCLQPGMRPSEVTCLSVHENMNLIAMGFADGTVVLLRGDVARAKNSKAKIVHEGPRPITGLGFSVPSPDIHLFVSTDHSVLSISVGAKDRENKVWTGLNVSLAKQLGLNLLPTQLDHDGCIFRCSTIATADETGRRTSSIIEADETAAPPKSTKFLVARQNGIHFFTTDDRGECLAFEGQKLHIYWFHGYLVIVSKDSAAMATRLAAASSRPIELNLVTVFDHHNKFIAYSAPMPQVESIMYEWGVMYVLCADGKLYRLQEKDTQSKLDILFSKKAFDVAISLADKPEARVNIYKQYADSLYSQGKYDLSMEQYIKTIGTLEASYVIRKFLDAQRIRNLTDYLDALHTRKLAGADHTTLLLNCYTKLKETYIGKLETFIKKDASDAHFDVETAIRVLRQAGYTDYALFLADRHRRHAAYLKLQLDDVGDHARALEYIARLPFAEADANMRQYGKMLMSKLPDETTELLKKLCSNYTPSDSPVTELTLASSAAASPADFIHIFVHHPAKLIDFLAHMASDGRPQSAVVFNTLFELYVTALTKSDDPKVIEQNKQLALELLNNPAARFDQDHVMVLCQINNFREGLLCLYERAHLYTEILKYYRETRTEAGDAKIIELCRKFGSAEPSLWTDALVHFADHRDSSSKYMAQVLEHIEEHSLMPPLQVIQTISRNENATLGTVKEYLIRQLDEQQRVIDENERKIATFVDETEKSRARIDDLLTTAQVFQNTKCSICSNALDLPSVHFLCQHSYHQACFDSYAESDSECPACMISNKNVLTQLAGLRSFRHQTGGQSSFFAELSRSSDAFGLVAEYFGRGLFSDFDSRPAPTPSGPVEQPPPPQSSAALRRASRQQYEADMDSAPSSFKDATPSSFRDTAAFRDNASFRDSADISSAISFGASPFASQRSSRPEHGAAGSVGAFERSQASGYEQYMKVEARRGFEALPAQPVARTSVKKKSPAASTQKPAPPPQKIHPASKSVPPQKAFAAQPQQKQSVPIGKLFAPAKVKENVHSAPNPFDEPPSTSKAAPPKNPFEDAAAPPNPFDSPDTPNKNPFDDAAPNPFDSPDVPHKNPFVSSSEPTNPFGDDDDDLPPNPFD